jgi:hypothetical protein
VATNVTVFWPATLCISERARRFSGTYCFHLEDEKLNRKENSKTTLKAEPSSLKLEAVCFLNINTALYCKSENLSG